MLESNPGSNQYFQQEGEGEGTNPTEIKWSLCDLTVTGHPLITVWRAKKLAIGASLLLCNNVYTTKLKRIELMMTK